MLWSMNLESKILLLAIARGYRTLAALARAAGISPVTLRHVVHLRRRATPYVIEHISGVLGVSTNELHDVIEEARQAEITRQALEGV